MTTREDAYPYPGEQYILSVDRYQIEVMDHLDELPATGAVIFCTFPCVRSSKYRYPAHTTYPDSIQSIRRPVRGRLLYGR